MHHVGSSRTAGSSGRASSPYVCQATRTPSRSTYPVASGSRAFMTFSFSVVGTIRTGIAPSWRSAVPASTRSAKSSMAWFTTTG